MDDAAGFRGMSEESLKSLEYLRSKNIALSHIIRKTQEGIGFIRQAEEHKEFHKNE